jgi:FkbM family methyltransferase
MIFVGVNDGSKAQPLVEEASALGKVMLIEPVPFLFARLEARYRRAPNIELRNIAIAGDDADVEFYAPRESATQVVSYADQLGSLLRGHAERHDSRLASQVQTIRAPALSFQTLIRREDVSSLDVLITDMEGADSDLLPSFPFSIVTPKQIIFEFKHSDGTSRLGRKLATVLILLEALGYHVSVFDVENLIAVHSTLSRPQVVDSRR